MDSNEVGDRQAKFKATPEMIEAGAEVLTRRWADLVSISEEELFAKVSAEMLEAAHSSVR